MAVLTPVRHEEAREFVGAYGIGELDRLEGIPAGSVNSNFSVWMRGGDRRFFLRVYEEQDEAGARAEAALLTHLAAQGVATPGPVAGRIGRLAGKPAALFPWRDGTMRCQAGVTAGDLERVGRELARVHAAGATYPGALPPDRFRQEDLLVRLDRIAADARFGAEAGPLREKLAAWGGRRDPTLPRGLIHGDLFRDNVLWDADGRVAALLDFESASDGVHAYDLAVTGLSWCFGDGFDPALFRALVSGYASERPLTAAETRGLRAEACFAALRFTITRLTDYAMRVTAAPRVVKDWRRFQMRLETLESLTDAAL